MRYIALVLAVLLLCGFDFKVTVNDDIKVRAITALCNNYKYQQTVVVAEEIENENGEKIMIEKEIPNPETPPKFALRMIKFFIRENIAGYEAARDAEASRQAALNKVRLEVYPSLDGGS